MSLSIYCDGSAHPQAGMPGGWAYVIVSGEDELLHRQTGGHPATTNNLMELRAASAGLSEVVSQGWHLTHEVELVSDSRMALDVANGSYLPKKDVEPCHALRALCVEAGARTRWVRGHSGVRWNEEVDALARAAMEALIPAKAKRRAERRKQRSG